jgi:hypothetical protein
MRSVTRFITGQDEIPKQFCPMMGGLTWFENTRNRVAQLIPVNRSFIVVKQSHRDLYEPLVGDLPRSQIVAQPCDRGTAPAILYGLVRARSLGPHTTVAIFPSDHYVSDDARFMRQVERAFDAVDAHPALAVCWASGQTRVRRRTDGSSRRRGSPHGSLVCFGSSDFGKSLAGSSPALCSLGAVYGTAQSSWHAPPCLKR